MSKHPDIERFIVRDDLVVLQRIGRIVGGAYEHHVHLFHDSAGRELPRRQLLIALVPYSPSGLGAQQAVGYPERPLQFEMNPMVHRVAERLGDNRGPLFEFLPIRSVTGDVFLVDSGGAHEAPLVMITVEPDLREILEPLIPRHLLGREVTVVVDNRKVASVLAVEVSGGFGLQKKVIGDKQIAHRSQFLAAVFFGRGLQGNHASVRSQRQGVLISPGCHTQAGSYRA